MKRRNFISNTTDSTLESSLLDLYAYKKKSSNSQSTDEQNLISPKITPTVKLSPSKWSLDKMILSETLNSMDFGDFHHRRERNEFGHTPSVDKFNKYKVAGELMPYTKGVSVKSFNFDKQGKEITMDFLKMSCIVKNAQYNGYLGIRHVADQPSKNKKGF